MTDASLWPSIRASASTLPPAETVKLAQVCRRLCAVVVLSISARGDSTMPGHSVLLSVWAGVAPQEASHSANSALSV